MDGLLLLVDLLYSLLFTAAGVMAVLEANDASIAKRLIYIGAMLMAIRWSIWGLTADSPMWARMVAGALIGAFILGGVPAAVGWIDQRHAKTLKHPSVEPPSSRAVSPSVEARKVVRTDIEAAVQTVPRAVLSMQVAHPKKVDDNASSMATSERPEVKPAVANAPIQTTAEASSLSNTIAQRRATLVQLTQLYILSHDGITPRMMAGMELPPVDFLNEELERQHATWRVSRVDGPNAATYDIAP